MNGRERYVLDTNVVVSALLFEQSTPGQAFYAALDRGDILLSLPVLKELIDVLGREKFKRYLLREERERFLDALVRETTLVDITENICVCRDPKDNKFLELAVCGAATCIISGDKDLLDLNPFQGIPIMKPDEFVASLSNDRRT
jgi:putative PIN family toxin of toxin-antitoxin system